MSLNITGAVMELTTFPQLAYPFTVAVWLRPRVNTATMSPFSLADPGGPGTVTCKLSSAGSGQCAYQFGSGGGDQITGRLWRWQSNVMPANYHNRWHLLVGMSRAASDHHLFTDGVWDNFLNTNQASMEITTELELGRNAYGTARAYSGLMEMLTFWNAALTASEIWNMWKGMHPLNVHRSSIITCYATMGRNPSVSVDDHVGSNHITTIVSGTPAREFDEPPVVYKPVRRYLFMDMGGASGAIAAAPAMQLAVAGAITGAGALSGAPALQLAVAGTLTGAGQLAGTSDMQLAPVADLKGAGALGGVAAIQITPAADLKGAGQLDAAVAIQFSPTGELLGAGALSGPVAVTFAPTGDLQGGAAGAIAGSVGLQLTPTATLLGAGAMAGSAALALAPSAALTGAGALAGGISVQLNVAGLIGGSGALAGSPALALAATAAITGSGTLAAQLPLILGPGGQLSIPGLTAPAGRIIPVDLAGRVILVDGQGRTITVDLQGRLI